ncbi:uncharacterized protein LOC126898641 [Daktulosphaira vitifoliae]|uniref:uncharacterized protein LOC126898641 n=1 Tax=Daktulosphaira vitifoliae TaxID=58002 RepID=UPI0021AB0A59|nr:uncharacterized protein LOC126898641 [Daktulosphaira vitifoliae]XP_050528853.1 uncharacterized protein LOC126898641 [Daktulosphaira vitifoliae]
MAALGDTSGDILPTSEHIKDILQMTRDSEMIQSYVRVAKVDDDDDDYGRGDFEEVQGLGRSHRNSGINGTNGLNGEHSGRIKAGSSDKGTNRGYSKRHGCQPGSATTTFNELAEEFKTRKSTTGAVIDKSSLGGLWTGKRHKRDSRSRLLEEVYTDKDRAAAVNLGTRDIKASLRMKRRQDRNHTLHIPSTAESPTLLALARHCMNDVKVSLDFIDKALELSPNDKAALVSRSKCYLLLGQPHLALKDAEVALKEDSTYLKAIYQKAEALYHLGDFEHALVFYHRGLHVRPELEQFRLGVQKAREAIENAISKIREITKSKPGFIVKYNETKQEPTIRRTKISPKIQSKLLLRELCIDKNYLEHLTTDPNLVSANQENKNQILNEIEDGINFLNSREEFWKQQKIVG